jgi:two-component system, NtrC family, sensor histidine kinase KinB
MRVGLRGKLAWGFGGLLGVLLALALAGIFWLSRLGSSVEVILRENFRSVLAAEQMKESLERMDSGALFSLTGDPEQGRALADLHGPRFEEALDLELSNITLPGERARAEEVGRLYRRYRADLDGVLDTARPEGERRRLYYGALLPCFTEIKGLADEILTMNQQSMAQASVRARHLAATARRQMVLALVLGAVVAAACVAFLGGAFLGPLGRLTASAQQIERGDYELVLEPRSDDEIGRLAEAFNSMARRLRALRRSDRARLVRAQRISQLTIDSLPDAVAVLTPEGEVELANRAATALVGLAPGEPVPPGHRPWVEPLLEEAERAGRVEARGGYEGALQVFGDGGERFLLPQAVAIRDAELGLVGTTIILVDVTELRRLDAMKSSLVATASHELMTPLTSLSMALHILLEEEVGPLERQQSELLVGARDDAERLRRILEGLLDVSRLESGRGALEPADLAAAALVGDAVEPLRAAFDDKGVELAVVTPPEGLRVPADRTRASLVLTNLLTNALKHTPAGGRVEVTTAAAAGGGARFAVADSGSGIAPEHLGRVFDRFFRVPGEAGPGAGLGLAIAREIVLAHGGAMGVESEPGRGSRFWFELPAAAAG